MKIGEKTLDRGGEMLAGIMKSYMTKINDAFLTNGEDALKIGLSLTISPGCATGNFKLEAGINFVAERVKDTFTDSVDEQQGNLFEEEGHVRCPERKGVLVPVSRCNGMDGIRSECPGRRTMHVAEDPTDPAGHVTYMSCRAWADADHKAFWDDLLRQAVERERREAKEERKAA